MSTRVTRYCSVPQLRALRACTSLVLALTSVSLGAAQSPAPTPDAASPESHAFKVFVGGRQLGEERVTVSDGAAGMTITSSGKLAPPLDISLQKAEAVYAPSGEAQRLSLEAVVKGKPVHLTTTFSGGRAASTMTQGKETTSKTDQVSPESVAVPQGVLFLGSYHGLARRLATAAQGASLKMYVAPVTEVDVNVRRIDEERMQTPGGTFDTKRISVTLPSGQSGEQLAMDVWIDAQGHLLRLVVPAQSLDVVREDVAAVSARRITVWRSNDEDVRVGSSGFALAATVSKPRPPRPQKKESDEDSDDESDEDEREREPDDRKYPAVVLVTDPDVGDRDGRVFGIPAIGQLANALADGGYVVIRYDQRGAGQSGGRTESATLEDYAEDVRAVVRYMDDRDDVDDDRITVIGHGEGAWIALLAAEREGRIAALVLLSAAGTTGSELRLEQQQHLLSRMNLSEQEREQKMAQQLTIQHAVETGADWDKVPKGVRKQADTPFFRSILSYDPAEVIKDVDQPMLIVHGELDKQVPPHHADKLLAFARARDDDRVAALTKLPGLNHLFVKARTGEVDEYAILPNRSISSDLPEAIEKWLAGTLPPRG